MQHTTSTQTHEMDEHVDTAHTIRLRSIRHYPQLQERPVQNIIRINPEEGD